MLLSSILAFIQEGAPEGAPEAAEESTSTGSGFTMIMWIVIIGLFVWMLIIKPMKDQKKRQEQINKLEKGTKVITNAGIYGRIREVKEKAFVIEIADGVKITVDKSCVYPVDENEGGEDKKQA